MPDDVRMHYTVAELPGPANVVPVKSVGKFSLRSFSKEELKGVVSRFKDIVKGAALIAGVDYELEQTSDFYNKIPVLKLNELLMEMPNWQVLQDWHHREKRPVPLILETLCMRSQVPVSV